MIGAEVAQANLGNEVKPGYPPLARSARVQGTVLLQVTIDKQGAIANLGVVSGHPLLVDAAVEAVRQWQYRPILLNGQPIEVVTTVTGVRSALDALAHDLKKALGCGATVEDGVLVVQGDQTARVRAFLEARGARKVIIGS